MVSPRGGLPHRQSEPPTPPQMAWYRASSSIDRRRYATSVRMHDDDVAKGTDKGKGKANMMSAIVVPALEDATQRPPKPTTTPTMIKARKRSSILYRASTTSSNELSEASTSSSSSSCKCWSRQDSSNRRGGRAGARKSGAAAADRFPRERPAYRCPADQHDADPEREGRNDDDDESDDDAPDFASTTTPSRPTTGPTTRRNRSRYDTRLGHYDPFGAARSVDRVTLAELSAASSTSPLPSLSPSRPPLFDDSDEDEDDNETSRIYYLSNTDDEDDEDDDVLCTPTSASGPVRRVSLGLIREPVKTMAVNDPLLSPPPPPMPILTFGRRGSKSAWLPASPLTTALVSPTTTPPTITTAASPSFPAFLSTSPTLMTSSILTVERVRSSPGSSDAAVSDGTTSKPLSPASPPPPTTATTVPKVSLLTKSLRSLAISLPNLQLPGRRPPLLSLDLEGLDVGERAPWNRPRRGSFGTVDSSLSMAGTTPSVELWTENPDEVLTMFQLQTFSAPPLPSSVNARQEQPLTSASASAERSANKKASLGNSASRAPVSSAPAAPAPVVTMPRYVSNQRHLLMLSLELEMMRRHKISAPLRGRAVVVRAATAPAGSARGCSSSMSSGGSGLRWEVMPAV